MVHVSKKSEQAWDRILRPGRWVRDFVDDLAVASPARLAIGSFVAVVALFAILLILPASMRDPESVTTSKHIANAVFVAVSAVCVTGLTPVVTEEYWSDFGISVITAGIQVGGLGILTLASVLGMAVSRRLGVRQRLIAQQATSALNLGQVGTLLKTVVITILTAEAIIAVLLFPRFLFRGEAVGDALWYSVFYAISAFNNAGFTIHPGGAAYFADDPWILCLLMLGVFVGALGFPVVLMIATYWNRPSRWDLHTKLTLSTTTVVLVVGLALLALFESSNPATLGDKNAGHTFVEVLFMAVMPRSGGFATMDIADMNQSSHLLMDLMMFIGGGSSSTAGGIKVTTVAVLVLAAYTEARGLQDVHVFGRRLTESTIKLSISILLTGATIVFVGTLIMLQISEESLDMVLFEVISAFGTVGLSSGVSASAPESGLYCLSVIMLIGRLGTITLAAALSMQDSLRLYRYPEERPVVG
ncbi:Trk-type K+ transport system membrane component [Brevibacterium sanguinis]|uniref:Trk-type K+ transport system membrane component n=2 Tax=Brevibacterium TaxID=1696 RepID=A0A366IEH7_9MICO|nr:MULTISPECIES: potassium transporter TrkG [Brevibacterium]RBP63154.1 Trk-type K+ transport system membrane component [Brevibacterium sanguinis]RBP69670.1 Trk-type K+ transport system membrane component [Brevibacterium celere]